MASTGIKTVAVIGATGVIGASFTALFLARGLKVITSPTSAGGVEKLKKYVADTWPTMELIGLSPGASQDNLEFVDNVLDHLDRVDFVSENGPESLEYKIKTFAELDAKAPPHVPLGSSSSGIPSSKFIGECKVNPARVLIVHPVNPPHLVPGTEVVPHPGTDSEVTDRSMSFLREIGQQPILINVECPGFVVNRLQAALNGEAMALVTRGVVSAADLDNAVTSAIGLRWALSGPFLNMCLSGGGGPQGINRLMKHIGPGYEDWRKDMEEHRVALVGDTVDAVTKKAEELYESYDGKADEKLKARNEALIELVKLKKSYDGLLQ